MGSKRKTDRKKGVPFKMIFRHHLDPDYYDPSANDKIFVPDVAELTEEQKKIVETFPERDRGIYKPGEAANVEADPLEAAVKKMKIRKEHKLKEKALKKKTPEDGRKVRFVDEQSDDESDG